jgi:uncharacterized protein (TIGR03083 family)
MQLQPLVADSYAQLADTLDQLDPDAWDSPSLCDGWRVRELIAHLTMPARLTVEQFGAELSAVNGDFQLLSDTIASRDSGLPIAEHLANLRSPVLAAWQPPGGGEIGALNHAVVHGLDVTNALQLPRACSEATAEVILTSLTEGGVGARFGVNLEGLRLEATDLDWSWGDGRAVSASAAELISLVCNRTLPDGRVLG